MPHIIVGTAGHIDHGKTALVKALTGIDADRLKEEKERGITIDLGFANLEFPEGGGIAFIDVPGHERFIKNMLAGVGGIDLVMLVIAADEAVMPQTREHLDICSLLRIRNGFTVLTKIDTVDEELGAMAEDDVRKFLKGSFLEHSPIVRVSSITGEGIPAVTELLRSFAGSVTPKDSTRIFRLPIDRAFTTKGFGTVVTGTLIAGRIQKGDEIEILPSGRRSRIRGIQVHGKPAAAAEAGQRTALNLQAVEVGEIQRGMVATRPQTFAASSMLDCHLELLGSAAKAIHIRKRIRMHIGTAELMGNVVLLGTDRLEPGQSAFVQIRLEEPVLALPGDRFIIRQYSPMITIGGGEILDAHPRKHRPTDKQVVDSLRILKDGSPVEQMEVLAAEAGLRTLDTAAIVRRLGIPENVVMPLLNDARFRIVGENPRSVLARRVFDAAATQTLAAVKEFHRANPLQQGIPREELRQRAVGAHTPGGVFQAILHQLAAEKKLADAQETIFEFGRTVVLKADEIEMRNQLEAQFEAAGLQAPVADEVANGLKLDRLPARKLVQLMIKDNVLVRISDEMVVHRRTLDRLVDDIRKLKAVSPKLGVAEFKNLTGLTRKHAIPLLEYLDRQKITRRVGEERLIL